MSALRLTNTENVGTPADQLLMTNFLNSYGNYQDAALWAVWNYSMIKVRESTALWRAKQGMDAATRARLDRQDNANPTHTIASADFMGPYAPGMRLRQLGSTITDPADRVLFDRLFPPWGDEGDAARDALWYFAKAKAEESVRRARSAERRIRWPRLLLARWKSRTVQTPSLHRGDTPPPSYSPRVQTPSLHRADTPPPPYSP